MNLKQQTPLLLPTLSFIVGCVVAYEFGVGLWPLLAILLASGGVFIYRGWSVALLIVAMSIGGLRGYTYSERIEKGGYEWSAESSVNDWAQLRVERLDLSPRAESMLKAMVLGDRSGITRAQRVGYGRSGASHILAVSGLHLSIIFLFVNVLFLPLLLLRRGGFIRNVLIVGVIWGYAYVVGMSPSVVRSAIMFSALQMAWVWGRPYSGVNALLFALLVAVALSPSILYNIGFQLSVMAVAAIYLWGLPLYYRLFGGGGFVTSALCISFVCSVATIPIVSHVFGYVPLLGVAFAPLFILSTFVVVVCGVVWILLPVPILSPIIRLIVESVVMIQDNLVGWISSKEWGYISWRATDSQMWLVLLMYVIITLLVWSDNDKSVGAD